MFVRRSEFPACGCEVNVVRKSPTAEVATAVGHIEMRTAPRRPILQRCFVYPTKASAAQAWKCIAYNVSATGIGIALPIELPAGTLLTIQAWNVCGASPIQVRIVHSKPVEHVWFTGCELLNRLSGAELHAWRSGPIDWLDDAQPA
jgi:hypothetical protein